MVDAESPLDENTREVLETQVKKGKARNFALILKGPEVTGLLVQKKPISEGAIAKLKKSCGGNVRLSGVCVGSGQDVEFQLLKSEYGDKEPGNPKKIKEFFAEHAEKGKKINPSYKMVEACTSISDDEAGEDLATEAEQEVSASKTPGAPSDDSQRNAYETLLAELLPKVTPILKGGGAIAVQIAGLLQAVRDDKIKEAYAAGLAKLEQVRSLLQARSAASLPQSPQPPPNKDAELPPTVSVAAEWEKQFGELGPRAREALTKKLGNTQAIKALLDYGQKLAQGQSYDQALGVLPDLREYVDKALATAPTQPLLDGQAWTAAKTNWQAANETVDGQINGLQSFFKSSGDELLEQLADFGLNAVTKNIKVRFQAALFDFDQAPQETQPQAASSLQKAIDSYAQFLGADAAVKLFDENEFGVKVSIQATLAPALQQLGRALQTYTAARN